MTSLKLPEIDIYGQLWYFAISNEAGAVTMPKTDIEISTVSIASATKLIKARIGILPTPRQVGAFIDRLVQEAERQSSDPVSTLDYVIERAVRAVEE
jgi:hypothetical protein